MKGKCKCGKIIDEVEFTQFGMCQKCWAIQDAYNRGYSDALFDTNFEREPTWSDNEGDHLRMEDDYD